ncbi:MAG: MBL fold metallo-hydrolase [Candidatus Omnitrophota bacterium]
MEPKVHQMEKIAIRDGMVQYSFIEADRSTLNSIFVCVDHTGPTPRALLIDAAYPGHARMVKHDLDAAGIKPEVILISHYHPDHAGGCSVFPGCAVYAPFHYETNFSNCQRWHPELTFIRPSRTFKNGDTFTFGPHRFEFSEAPGHSRCSMFITINQDVLHIGDLLMLDCGDKLNLPYISLGGNYKQYIDTLERLKTMPCHGVIIPHGTGIYAPERIIRAADDYLFYLRKVLSSAGNLPLSACLRDGMNAYAHPEFHDNNLMQLMLEQ